MDKNHDGMCQPYADQDAHADQDSDAPTYIHAATDVYAPTYIHATGYVDAASDIYRQTYVHATSDIYRQTYVHATGNVDPACDDYADADQNAGTCGCVR